MTEARQSPRSPAIREALAELEGARWDKRDELGDECAPEDDLAAAETVSTKGEPAGGLDT